ncbi:MAG TPA: helix-turn-helix transcriptional regulator [Pseudonocardia sp.]|jgi:transcriptional regulator with XRE-family HTH domain|nr:helix-turn-helix transcriptional regulator [Pseudonocardia sp.]
MDNALGEFLRARRRLVDPAGLPDHRTRRAPGLRREELALLAGVSTHYYARLEQGRDRHPSPQVLDALARALELDADAAGHLRRLATSQPPRRRRAPRPEQVRPELAALLDRWTTEAAVVIGRYRDVLASNAVAPLVNPGFAVGRNLVRDAFLDPSSREVYVHWREVAEGSVSGLRASAGADPDDPRLSALVGELSVKSEEFRRMWARHDVRDKTGGTKTFRSPLVGELALRFEAFTVVGPERQTMYVFHPEPGTRAAESMALLAGLAAPAHDRAPVAPRPGA